MADFNGSGGDDTYSGGAESDQIYGNGGNDTLSGGGEYDYIEGGAGDDVINGQDGNDLLLGDFGSPEGNDVISGGNGFDEMYGGGGNDSLSGDADDDLLFGESGNDQLFGGSGNDFLRGGAGLDSFDGGSDDGVKWSAISGFGDRVSFAEISATQAVIADLRTGVIANDGFGNAETMTGIESIGPGTAFADQFYGNDGRNSVAGGRGDTLMAFGGDDRLTITGAPAVLDGGDGVDLLQLLSRGGFVPNGSGTGAVVSPAMTAGYVVDLAAGTLADGHGHAGGIAGIEQIMATELGDVVRGSGADEWVAPGDGSDTIDGRGGIDTISYFVDHYDYYHNRRGGIFVDLAAGQVVETIADVQIVPGPQDDRASPPSGTVGAGASAESTDTLAGIENVEGTGLGDTIYGDDGDNRIAPRAGNDVVDGRGGIDTIDYSAARAAVTVRLDTGSAVESGTGETNFAFGPTDDLFGVIVEADDYSAKTDQLANIENAVGSGFADDLRGNGLANRIDGGEGNDFIRLMDGGSDTALGGAGNDVFLFGGALTSADVVDGGAGTDQIALQGDYSGAAALLLGANMVSVENIAILPGNDTRFGDPGTNFYDLNITTTNEAVAAGVQLVVDANRLRVGEDFTFNGSAETDGSFFIYGGLGTDILTGGAKNDVFIFGGQGQWGSSDVVTGGAGIDQLALRGNYTIVFGAGQLIGVEQIAMVSAQDTRYGALGSSYSYNLTVVDANIDGIQMTIDAAPLRPGETLTFNGSAEDDGSFRVFGGRGNDSIVGSRNGDILVGNGGSDQLTGGAGADAFRYVLTTDSTTGGVDKILDFLPTVDLIDLSRIDADTNAEGNQAFRWIGSNAFGSSGTPAGELRAWREPDGSWFVEGDTNGDGAADLIIEVVSPFPLGQTDFLL